MGAVPSYSLLIALMASPIVGILISILIVYSGLGNRISGIRGWSWLPISIAATIAMLAAWLLRNQPLETTIANWTPVSVMGMPLALAGNPALLLVLAAWATTYFVRSLHLPSVNPFEEHPTASALIIPALAIVALGNNLITILVGLGITDILTAYQGLRRSQAPQHTLLTLLFNGLSTTCFLIVIAAYYATGSSLALPLAKLPESFAGLLSFSLALRLGFVPFRVSPFPIRALPNAPGVVAGLMVLIHLHTLGLPILADWFYTLATVSALVTLLVGILQESEAPGDLHAMIFTSGAYLAAGSAIAGEPNVTACASASWLLGCTLISFTATAPALPDTTNSSNLVLAFMRNPWAQRGLRAIGAATLMSVILTIGFIGQSGVWTATVERSWLGLLTFLLRLAAFILMGYALIHLVLDNERTDIPDIHITPTTFGLRVWVGGTIAALAIVLIGLTGGLGDAIARNDVLGWLALVLSLSGAIALSRLEPIWSSALTIAGPRIADGLRLAWLEALLSGALARIRQPLPRVFTLLESDGALLLAVIIALLVVLVSRPGTP